MSIQMHNRPLTPEQVAEQERIEAIFQPTGSLNIEAIRLLIGWAEQDEETLRQWRSLDLWGTWDQGVWTRSTTGLPSDVLANVEDEEEVDVYDRDTHDTLLDEADRAYLNGACQSAYCMAGQAVTQAGYKMQYQRPTLSEEMEHGFTVSAENCVPVRATGERDQWNRPVLVETGPAVEISIAAASILGIDDDQASSFFSGSNGIDTLKELANQFAHDEGLTLPYPEHGLYDGEEEDEYEDDDEDEVVF